jgi:hypothetical protein
MGNDTVLKVESVDSQADGEADVVVRCLRGTLRVGQEVRITDAEGGSASGPAPLTVRTIWRYGKTVDFLDPPLSGKLELVGEVDAIGVGSLITTN